MRIQPASANRRPNMMMRRKQQPTEKKWNLSKCLFFTKLVLYLIPHRPLSSSLSPHRQRSTQCIGGKDWNCFVGTKPVTTSILHRRQRPFLPRNETSAKKWTINNLFFNSRHDRQNAYVRARRWKKMKFCSYFLLKRIKPVYYFNITFWKYFTSPGPPPVDLVLSFFLSSPVLMLSDLLFMFFFFFFLAKLLEKGLATFLFSAQIEWKIIFFFGNPEEQKWIESSKSPTKR